MTIVQVFFSNNGTNNNNMPNICDISNQKRHTHSNARNQGFNCSIKKILYEN